MRDFNVYMCVCKCVREVKIFLSNYRWGTHFWRRILWKHLTRPPRNSIGARRWWSGSPWPEIPSITPLLAETEQVVGLLPSLAETTIRSVCLLHTLMRTYIHTYIHTHHHALTRIAVYFLRFFLFNLGSVDLTSALTWCFNGEKTTIRWLLMKKDSNSITRPDILAFVNLFSRYYLQCTVLSRHTVIPTHAHHPRHWFPLFPLLMEVLIHGFKGRGFLLDSGETHIFRHFVSDLCVRKVK